MLSIVLGAAAGGVITWYATQQMVNDAQAGSTIANAGNTSGANS